MHGHTCSQFTQATIRALLKLSPDETLYAAAVEFDELQDRKRHPETNRDNGNRYFLKKRYACCEGIRTPSRSFPFSELVHGRTALHVAHASGVPERVAQVRAYRNLMKKHPLLRTSPAIGMAATAAYAAQLAISEIDSA